MTPYEQGYNGVLVKLAVTRNLADRVIRLRAHKMLGDLERRVLQRVPSGEVAQGISRANLRPHLIEQQGHNVLEKIFDKYPRTAIRALPDDIANIKYQPMWGKLEDSLQRMAREGMGGV